MNATQLAVDFGDTVARSAARLTPVKTPVLISSPPTLLLMHSIVTYSVVGASARRSLKDTLACRSTSPPTLSCHPLSSTTGSLKFLDTT